MLSKANDILYSTQVQLSYIFL